MKNNTILTIVASLAFGGSAFAGTTSGKGVVPQEVAPAASPLSAALTVGYASTYEFRGYEIGYSLFNADLTATYAITDKLSVSAGAWYGTLWDGNYDEIDLTGGISYDFGPVSLGALYRHYFYDGFDENNEVGLTLATDSWYGISLNAAGYYDFEFEGWYFETGVTFSHQFTDMVGFSLASGVSYVSDYFTDADNGFNHVYVQASLPISLKENVTLTPFVRTVFALDAVNDAGGDDETTLGGANLTVTF